MATLFKDVKYNLQGLINNIDMGTIGLPDIQRPFVWPDTKVRQLFDSLYKGYPVGYLLFWENANINGIKSIGTEKKQRAAQLLIVDGQQRLTTFHLLLISIYHRISEIKPLEADDVIINTSLKTSSRNLSKIKE